MSFLSSFPEDCHYRSRHEHHQLLSNSLLQLKRRLCYSIHFEIEPHLFHVFSDALDVLRCIFSFNGFEETIDGFTFSLKDLFAL